MADIQTMSRLTSGSSQEEIETAICRGLKLWSNRTNSLNAEKRQEALKVVKLLEDAEQILLDAESRIQYETKAATASNALRESGVYFTGQDVDLIAEGRRLLIKGELADALLIAEMAVDRFRSSASAWALSGAVHHRWGNFSDAIAAFNQAIRLDPRNAELIFDLGCVLESGGEPNNALTAYRQAHLLDRSATHYRAAVGNVLIYLGNYTQGIRILKECVRERPDNVTYTCFLGLAHEEKIYRQDSRASL